MDSRLERAPKFETATQWLPRSLSSSLFCFPEKQQIFNGGFKPPQYARVSKIAIRF